VPEGRRAIGSLPSILRWNPSGSGSSPDVDVETASVPSAGGSTVSLQSQSDSPRIKGRIGCLRMEDLLGGTVQIRVSSA
jgi:hypothetical protein